MSEGLKPEHTASFVDAHKDKVFDFRAEGERVAKIMKGKSHRDIEVISKEVAGVLEKFVIWARDEKTLSNPSEIMAGISSYIDKIMYALQEARADEDVRNRVEAQLQSFSSIDILGRNNNY